MSAATISTPWAVRALAALLFTLRVMPLIFHVPSLSAAVMTDPPWVPVAPTTVRSLAICEGEVAFRIVEDFVLYVYEMLLDESAG
jgi:hypothetical protein